jgi:RNA methyltransferase, TrmH family
VVEGLSLVEQAIAAEWEIDEVYWAHDAEIDPAVAARLAPCWHLGPGVMQRVVTTETAPSVVAVLRDRPRSLPAGADFVIAADRLGDPGNLGTIVRSAEAAGADAVVLSPGSVDAWNPKSLRAAAGSSLRLPVVTLDLALLGADGRRVIGTSSHRGLPYTDVDLTGPVALLVGNEAHGLPESCPVDEWVTIPHVGPTESLNVAMAATLLVFEVARQRRSSYRPVPSPGDTVP